MLEKQINALRTILESSDLKAFKNDAFRSLIHAVVSGDPSSVIDVTGHAAEFLFHIPTILFWDKMKRFLLGSFRSFEDQVQMASKFHEGPKYNAFIKRQIHLINEIDDDLKIDYFSALTRCFLLTNLQEDLYFKLAKIISVCTPSELTYIKDHDYNYISPRTMTISLLCQHGLFMQTENCASIPRYVMSDLAKALKQSSLNFDEQFDSSHHIVSFDVMTPLPLPEPTPWQTIQDIVDSPTDPI